MGDDKILEGKKKAFGSNIKSQCLVGACQKVFDYFKDSDGTISRSGFFDGLAKKGILEDDPRIKEVLGLLRRKDGKIPKEEFLASVAPNISLLEKVCADDTVIPNFAQFSEDLHEMYNVSAKNDSGAMADYIPSLAKQNPEHWGVAVCSVDGQRLNLGDCDVGFCVQSCSKPITYCMALEEHGTETVHKHVGREPSGEEFNALKLSKDGLPHNPLINSGAIMTCSLIRPGDEPSDRFDFVTKQWARLAGGKAPGYSNAVYLSERSSADRNFALAYFMNENNAFPKGTDLTEVLEFYFQCCSLTMNADQLSIVAATLANGGVCPLTGEQVLSSNTVRHCLSMMFSCGMYDYSGEFAFKIGLPAKSGVAGGVFVVIPNVAGFCTFSPNLDQYGNSVRGVEFYTRLTDKFNFHNFDCLALDSAGKKDPRKLITGSTVEESHVEECIKYCSMGDVSALKRLRVKGVDFDLGDYDQRCPLHLAASNGHFNVVKFLVENDLVTNVNPIDRWGGTPLDDAESEGYIVIGKYLTTHGGVRGPQKRRNQIMANADAAPVDTQ